MITALVLSLLVIPGAGHIFIGKKLKGFFLAIASVFFIVVPLVRYGMVASYALNVMAVQRGGPAINLLYAGELAWPEVRNIALLSLAALTLIWAYAAIDVYLETRGRR